MAEIDSKSWLHVAPILRGAGFDGAAGPLVRCLADAPTLSDPSLVLEIAEAKAFADGFPVASAIVDAVGRHIEEHDIFPSVVRIGGRGFVIGDRPETLALTDSGPTSGALAGLRRRAETFRGGNEKRNDDPGAKAVAGRIAVVTGGAQGFGLEIASALVEAGAFVFLADLNIDGATAGAEELNGRLGRQRAFPVEVNVASEESVARMVDRVVEICGGIDLFVSNAGVLKAGSVKELSEKDFRFVTDVNYVGFFLCSKHASVVMSAQEAATAARPGAGEYYTDIIQINSKSGLEGSNKNGAYAGSKFGGIGLVQSFALELVANRIKVNAICPGNFFDGPLWSDPDRGLFVQYLNAGKVPGAASVADVRAFYEEKVPMKRGCTGPDVVKAIYYLVNQIYETGQALPVTGGQVMMK